MRLAYVVSYVADIHASLDFYERAFGLRRRYVEPEGHYAEVETGTTVLAFVSTARAAEHLPVRFRPSSRESDPAGIELSLITDDVDAAYSRALEHGAIPVAAPVAKPWGQKLGYVRDADGVIVGLMSEPAG